MSKGSGLQNVNNLRRKFRAMSAVMENSIRPAIIDSAEAIRADAVERVAKDTGDLAASIEYKVSADGLTAVIGPSAASAAVVKSIRGSAFATRSAAKISGITKEKLFQFFKGYWQEFGTKGSAERNIPPQPAKPFMRPAFDVNKDWAVKRVSQAINEMLKKAQNL